MTPATGMFRSSASCIPITAKIGMPMASMTSMSFWTVSALTMRVSGAENRLNRMTVKAISGR